MKRDLFWISAVENQALMRGTATRVASDTAEGRVSAAKHVQIYWLSVPSTAH